MEEVKRTCIECYEGITNPVCARCFIKQINYWLRDNGVDFVPREAIIDKLERELLIKSFKHNPEEHSQCIICGEDVAICSYCFFTKATRIFKEFNFDQELTESFMEIFSYNKFEPKAEKLLEVYQSH